MIIRAPLKTDTGSKCSRWWVKFYNTETHKHEMHTVRGTRKDAEKYERDLETKQEKGDYVARKDRKIVQAVHELFQQHRRAHHRRSSSEANYDSSMRLYVLPKFGGKEIGAVKQGDCTTHFDGLRAQGKSAATVNRAVKAFRSLLTFARKNGHGVDKNVLEDFPLYKRAPGERTVNRGAFNEGEVRAILEEARPREKALIALLVFTGLRPGEVYALDWQSIDMEEGRINVRRNWDSRGKVFNTPKTEAGTRIVPASDWVLEQVIAYRALAKDTAPNALVFSTWANREYHGDPLSEQALMLREAGMDYKEISKRLGKSPSRISQYVWHARRRRQLRVKAKELPDAQPLNSSNVRRDIWLPLKKRAKVRDLDLYSLRHTFVTFALGENSDRHSVARAIGHARSDIVDRIYGNHTLDSGVAPISANVTRRAFGGRPKLKVISGGRRAAGGAK
jgi:integrase